MLLVTAVILFLKKKKQVQGSKLRRAPHIYGDKEFNLLTFWLLFASAFSALAAAILNNLLTVDYRHEWDRVFFGDRRNRATWSHSRR